MAESAFVLDLWLVVVLGSLLAVGGLFHLARWFFHDTATPRVVCAWHKKNFGYELVMREGRGETSHSICAACRAIEFSGMVREQEEMERHT